MSLLFKIATDLDAKGFKDAAKHVRQMEKDAKGNAKATDEWRGKTDKLKMAYQGIIGLGIVAFYKNLIDETVKLEQSEFLLGQRVENTGLKWDEQKEKVLAYNKVLSEMTGISYPEVNDALARLIDSTNDTGKAQEYLAATLGLARAQGISYATAAEQVGRATLGVTEFTKTLAERIGIAGEKARDVSFVLTTFKERFGELAIEEDTAAKNIGKFKNALQMAKAEAGEGLIPALTLVMKVLVDLGKVVNEIITLFAAGFALIVMTVQTSWDEIRALFTGGWDAAKQASLAGQKGQILLLNEMADAAGRAWKIASGQEAADKELPDTLDKFVKGHQKLTAQFRKMQAELLAEQAIGTEERVAHLLEAIEAEKEIQAKAIADRMAAEGYGAEQINAMIAKSNAALHSKQNKLLQHSLMKRTQMYMQFGQIVGTATGASLTGQVDAWKQASVQIIDMIAQRAQAAIMANVIQGASVEVGNKGIIGLATGAGLLAWGVAQAATVAGLAAAAKGAIGASGGSAGGAAAPSMGGGSAPSATAAAAVEPEEKSTVRVVIMGDMYGEEEFVNRMAEKLSAVVENNDVRLVATQIQ